MGRQSYTPPYQLTSNILNIVEQIGERLGWLKADTTKMAVLKLRRGNRIRMIQETLPIPAPTSLHTCGLREDHHATVIEGFSIDSEKKHNIQIITKYNVS
jgi:hypothetical protein